MTESAREKLKQLAHLRRQIVYSQDKLARLTNSAKRLQDALECELGPIVVGKQSVLVRIGKTHFLLSKANLSNKVTIETVEQIAA